MCGEHAAALFQRLCAEMIRERPAREPTREIYKPVEFTARAIVPGENMMETAVGRSTRTTCQFKHLMDGPAQAGQAPDVERLTAAMTEAASAIGSLQHEVSELKAAREDRLADLESHRVDADRRMTEAGRRLTGAEKRLEANDVRLADLENRRSVVDAVLNELKATAQRDSVEADRRLSAVEKRLHDLISGVKLDLNRLLDANNMNASSVFDLSTRMGASEKILDRHASTLKRFFEEDSHNALSNRVARLEAAVEATALAWGTGE